MIAVFHWVWLPIIDADKDATHEANRTLYACKNVKCQCIPERMLCGEDGSIGKNLSKNFL